MRRAPLMFAALLSACTGYVGDLDGQPAQPEPGTTIELPAPNPEAQQPPMPLPGAPRISSFVCTPLSGPAPLNVSCEISAAHPDSTAFTCTLKLSDGRVLFDAGDCRTTTVAAATFASAGNFQVTLEVKDVRGKSTRDVRDINVQPKPNLAPVIAAFTATPLTGAAPLTSQLVFAASDPDGDALTCSLDFGADGTVEQPNLDCAAGSVSHTVQTASTVKVKLEVKDARGLATTQELSLTAKPTIGDVRIAKVEWGQSIITETPRLVGTKPALLRVHLLADRPGIANVTLDAEGFNAAGVSLGKLSLTGPSTPPTAEQPAALDQQWRAMVPDTWVVPGFEVRLKVDPNDVLAETNETNNTRTVKPVVGKANVMQLTAVPVVHQGQTAATPDLQPLMMRLWPVRGVQTQTRAPYTFSGTLSGSSTAGWGTLLQQIAGVRQADGSSRNYYGWVKVGYGSGIAGIGYIGQEASTGRDDSTSTAAHELGHNLGRNHAPCGGAAGADPSYPHAGGRIGSWGFDTTGNRLVNPSQFFDLMSYCNPEWVSDYSYGRVQQFLEAAANVTGGGAAPYEATVYLAGVLEHGVASLRPMHRLFAAPSPAQDGNLRLRLTTIEGRIIELPVSLTPVGDSDEEHFSVLVRDPGPLAAIEVVAGGKVLARQLAAPAAPTAPTQARLSRLSPNEVLLTWDASNYPSAQLAHFAADGTRTTLALDLQGGQARVATGLLAGRFELSLSNGATAIREDVLLDR